MRLLDANIIFDSNLSLRLLQIHEVTDLILLTECKFMGEL